MHLTERDSKDAGWINSLKIKIKIIAFYRRQRVPSPFGQVKAPPVACVRAGVRACSHSWFASTGH
jgi:hypothetical protein